MWGKYEEDRPWPVSAAALVLEGRAVRGARRLNREHVFEAWRLVKLLPERPRDPEETADLLDEKLVPPHIDEVRGKGALEGVTRSPLALPRPRSANGGEGESVAH